MSGTVKHARLESQSARDRLKRGRQPHWQALIEGRVHLGWQRWKGKKGEMGGRWLLRRYIPATGKYRVQALGRADDATRPDGADILSFEQAKAKAHAMVVSPNGNGNGAIVRLTVRQAMHRYIDYKHQKGQPVGDLISRSNVHIIPTLGDLVVSELTAEQLRRWLSNMAHSPAQRRAKGGKPQYRSEPTTDEEIRQRRASANRVLTMLKAALNHAYDEGHVASRDAWGRRLAPFGKVEVARLRYLTVAEAERLMNACAPDFRALVRAGLETGCRYGELVRWLDVCDFNPDASTLAIRQSKTGKPRHVVLTAEGAAFFRAHTTGRAGHERMFTHADGSAWGPSEQARPMAEACERAKIKPAISFHILRHTWASHSVMNGVPLMVVAKNLGHSDTRMVEKHYGHLAPSFIADAIRAGAPRYRVKDDKRVVPLR
jgi:integrase